MRNYLSWPGESIGYCGPCKASKKKMHDIGITGSAHSLFESYLEKRKLRVKINNSISSEQTIILCGVPRGTTLSPVLLNIQLNYTKLLNLNSNIICYPNDTVLICSGFIWKEVFQILRLIYCLLKSG